jgi:hypothetical protein
MRILFFCITLLFAVSGCMTASHPAGQESQTSDDPLPSALSGSCELFPVESFTMESFLETSREKLKNSILLPKKLDNKCFPNERSRMLAGNPICLLANLVPVRAIAVTSPDTTHSIDTFFLIMRGDPSDVKIVTSYLDSRFQRATEEYLSTQKHQRFYGPATAWKDNGDYYFLYQTEPGYDPPAISLFLAYGTKDGLARQSIDLNTCK